MDTIEFNGRKWVELPIEHALKFSVLPCDLYIRISSVKLIKLVQKDESYSSEIIDRYMLKGVKTLFVGDEDFEKLSRYIHEEYTSNFSSGVDNSVESSAIEGTNAVSIANITLRELGVSSETTMLLNEVCSSCISVLKSNASLTDIISSFQKRNDFLFGHSVLTSYIAGLIGVEMGWKTSATLEKLAYASILHDVALDNNIQAMCEDLQEGHAELTRNDLRTIKDHCTRSKELADQVAGLPPDVSDMIFCHHEIPDGSGYPCKLTGNRISQISATFILAEQFAKQVYGKHLSRGLVNDAIDFIKAKYSKGNFKAPLVGLLKVVDNYY